MRYVVVRLCAAVRMINVVTIAAFKRRRSARGPR